MNVAENNIPSPDPRHTYLDWHISSGFAKALHRIEAEYLLNQVQLTYNQTILQVGGVAGDNLFIRQYFERNHVIVDNTYRPNPSNSPRMIADFDALPVADDSVDVVILPHLLEFQSQPHAVLSEIDRVLKPEGQIFVFCFNPWRVDRFSRYTAASDRLEIPNAITPHKLMNWMGLLRFQPELLAGFHPSSSQSVSFPTGIIGQSKTILATAYLVKGIKRIYTMIPVRSPLLRPSSFVPGRAIDPAVLGNLNEAQSNRLHGRSL